MTHRNSQLTRGTELETLIPARRQSTSTTLNSQLYTPRQTPGPTSDGDQNCLGLLCSTMLTHRFGATDLTTLTCTPQRMDVILPLTKPGEEQSCSYENHSSLLSGWQSLAMLSNLYKYGMSTDVRIWSHILFHQAATFLARIHGQLQHKSTPLHMSPSENTTRTSIHLMCNNIRIGQLSETIPGTKKSHQKQVQEQRSYTK